MTETDVTNILDNSTVILSKWDGQRFLYVAETGAVAVDNTGKIITVMNRDNFKEVLELILREAID